MARQPSKWQLIRFHLAVGVALALAGAAALWWGLSKQPEWTHLVGCWLVAVNVVTFGYYGYDKGRARSAGASRVPETTLHTLTAAGGSAGAFAAMRVFRHKSIKPEFRMMFWIIVVLQLSLALWIVKLVWFP